MIGRLVGVVVGQGDDGTVTIDVNGVGYEVTVPLGVLGRARHDDHGRTTLHVHTVVREDAFQLYGFASLEEREVFRILISVSNVGPKIATAILGAIPPNELASAIARKEVARLTAIGGVGKKTAERLILELKDKVGALALPHAPPVITNTPAALAGLAGERGKEDLLRSALSNMGFKPVEVDRAVDSVREKLPSLELAALVREALPAAR